VKIRGQEYSLEIDGEFTFVRPKKIECSVFTCKHHEECSKVGVEQAGILPKAKSIFDVLGLDFQLPGHGKQYDDCGDWRYRGCLHLEDHIQEELGESIAGQVYVEWYHRSCYRPECPVCYEKWAALEASKIEHRLKYFWENGKVIHVTLSPPEKDVLNLPYPLLKSKMHRIAKNRGIVGGSIIWHPWRQRDDGSWYFSPHFHILGFGWVRNVREGFNRDGWVVKNILDGKNERSVFRTAMYQLSHCGVSKNHRTVTWFGVCSSASKKKVPPMEKQKHICPSCGAELVQLRYLGDPDELPDKIEEGHAWMDPGSWCEHEFRGDYG
jgi:hypothetical protein